MAGIGNTLSGGKVGTATTASGTSASPLKSIFWKGREFYEIVPKNLTPPGWCNYLALVDTVPDVQELKLHKLQGHFTKPIPIIGQADNALYLFKDGNTFYFWGAISATLQCVDFPKDITGILDCLRKESGLQYHEVETI